MVPGSDVGRFSSTLESSQNDSAQFVATNSVEYSFIRKKSPAGDFVELVEKHPEGRVHRIIIAQEAHGGILHTLNTLKDKYFASA